MISYRFKRRAFLTAMGGGLGLKIMLRNLEASAQGMRSPARLLVTQWPVGIVAGAQEALWKPTSGSVGGSPGLKPFADAGLGPDMTVLRGISTTHLTVAGLGGPEQGTVTLVTGLAPGGSRANCCEGDDAFAAPGGSFDQILLRDQAALQRPGKGYANSIADSRTDFAEVSTQCLSYSTATELVQKYGGTGTATQAIPLRPTLSALVQYNNLFGSMTPGGGTGGATGTGGGNGSGGAAGRPVADAIMRRLVRKKSVLDFAIEELNQMKALAPGRAKDKLSIHTDAILQAEESVLASINTRYPNIAPGTGGSTVVTPGPCGGTCTSKPAAPSNIVGGADPSLTMGFGSFYGRDTAARDDAPDHQIAGKAHLDVLKAAFVCDLIRVGTFQWSPGSNHVGFKLYPNSTTPFQHHPLSHRLNTPDTIIGSTPDALGNDARFLYNVQLWYFSRHAENFAGWKTALDGCGNSLLDHTCVPFLTEVGATSHERTNMPGMIIGGKALGFSHNLYRTGALTINDLWGTIGQAFGQAPGGVFGNPVPGLWTKPA